MLGKVGTIANLLKSMNVEEVVKLADHLVFSKTGQYLDDLQKTILYGTLQGKKYTQIAE